MMTDVNPYTGIRADRPMISYDATCPAAVRLVDTKDGHVIAAVEASGHAELKLESTDDATEPQVKASQDAATRVAKKLASALKGKR
jgi:hypothetical protein